MTRVAVTGGSGQLGTWVLREFVASGYDVLNIDVVRPVDEICPTIVANLGDLGQVYQVLSGVDAVVHLAAIPRAGFHPNDVVFRNNVMSTYHILEAAASLRIPKAVIGSSESIYGIASRRVSPSYVPVDEHHTLTPFDCYGLSKVVNESTAEMFHRASGMQIACLRFGNVISPGTYAEKFPAFIRDPDRRKHLMWSYIDARDAASACRLATERDGLGCVVLNIAADENSMDIESRTLMQKGYPEVEDYREDVRGYDTLLSNTRAKALLGWAPVHQWRDEI